MLHVQYPTPIVSLSALGWGSASPVRNKDDGLIPVVLQQPILHLASASLDDTGDDEYVLRMDNVGDDRTTMTITSSCCPIVLQRPLVLLSLASPSGA